MGLIFCKKNIHFICHKQLVLYYSGHHLMLLYFADVLSLKTSFSRSPHSSEINLYQDPGKMMHIALFNKDYILMSSAQQIKIRIV